MSLDQTVVWLEMVDVHVLVVGGVLRVLGRRNKELFNWRRERVNIKFNFYLIKKKY